MAKYLDPKADVTFKKVFGGHKNLVISLLSALLPLDEGKQVEWVDYAGTVSNVQRRLHLAIHNLKTGKVVWQGMQTKVKL
jgi:hypothetical protein